MKIVSRTFFLPLFFFMSFPAFGQFAGLEPALFWSEFAAVTAIYRPSRSEQKIAEYIVKKADELNLESSVDGFGNVIVKMPASRGCQNWPGLILQSHLDMVCIARSNSDFDWGSDAIEPFVDNGWLKARQTTLGADNGVGVAAMLSLMVSPPSDHGSIEFLFTVDEEGDFSGVCGLEPGQLQGKYLLNLDSEESGEFNVGCAGGQADSMVFSFSRKMLPEDYVGLKITLDGGLGGHSGVDIHRGRANCITEILKLARQIIATAPVNLIEIKGGTTDTAIPDSAEISLCVKPEFQSLIKTVSVNFFKSLRNRYKITDPDLNLIVTNLSKNYSAISDADSKKIIECLYEIPSGILAMSRSWPGNVQTSMNPGVIKTTDNELKMVMHLQGSTMPVIEMLSRRVGVIAQKFAAVHEAGEPYQPWEPGGNDDLLNKAIRVHEEVFGKRPLLKVVHAGVECGELKKTFPHIQMVSFGPDIRHAHSPEEKLRISSVKPFLDLLNGIIGSR